MTNPKGMALAHIKELRKCIAEIKYNEPIRGVLDDSLTQLERQIERAALGVEVVVNLQARGL